MRIITIATAIAAMVGVADAQTPQNVVSSQVWVEEARQQGELTGCTLRFSIAFQDYAYRRGAISGIVGSVSMHSVARAKPQACAGGNLKVIGVDLYTDRAPDAFAVAQAYVSLPAKILRRPLPVGARYQCDEPTAFCGVYGIGGALEIVGALVDREAPPIEIGLSRGGIDMSVPVTMDEKARLQFSVCWISLMAEVQPCVEAMGASRR